MKIDEFHAKRKAKADFDALLGFDPPIYTEPHRWAVVEDDTGEVSVVDMMEFPKEGENAAILYLPVDEHGDCTGSVHVGYIYGDHQGGFILRNENQPDKHFDRQATARCIILGRGWLIVDGQPLTPLPARNLLK